MLSTTVLPSTLDGIKRLAKTIKRDQNCNHSTALNLAAQRAGFSNFKHAQNAIKPAQKASAQSSYFVFISMSWWDKQSNTSGVELLKVPLSQPLPSLLSQSHLGLHKDLYHFRQTEVNHLDSTKDATGKIAAQKYICKAARVIQFIDATNLRPSKSHSRVYPGGSSMNRIPGQDHYSSWYHPETKTYILVDEPYGPAVQSQSDVEARMAWAARHEFVLVKSSWQGMYHPAGNSELYLAAPKSKTDLINEIMSALSTLPSPYVLEDWQGESLSSNVHFKSPGKMERLAMLQAQPTLPPRDKKPSASKIKTGMNPHRKLFVLALNELLKKNLLTINWDGSSRDNDGFLETTIAEKITVINWRDHGSGEILITVWWNYDESRDPRASEKSHSQTPLAHRSRYQDFVGVVASIWLERERGQYLQGKGSEHISNKYARKGELEILRTLPNPEPIGYLIEGKFIF